MRKVQKQIYQENLVTFLKQYSTFLPKWNLLYLFYNETGSNKKK